MKYLRFFLILFLIPFMVLAEECDVSNITITSMKPNKIEGNTEVISDPTFEGRTINLNLKMYDVGDSISYDMTIKNDSNEDYMIDEDTFKTDSDYIEYTLKTKDNTNVVKANSTKEVSLIVTYKNEIDDSLLTNNKFNASNSLKLSLNTNDKEKPLDVITTNDVKKIDVKNPLTSNNSISLVAIMLLIVALLIFVSLLFKKRFGKYTFLFILFMVIPTVYAICKCDIEVDANIEIEKVPSLFDEIIGLSKEDNTCVIKYEGDVTDEVGKTVTATNVYFNNCLEQRNVIFGGFCWQIIRTTETKGIKVVYNGESVDGKCDNTRPEYTTVVNYNDSINNTAINSFETVLLYGEDYEYDESNNRFSIINPQTIIVDDNNRANLIGKYTCGSSNNSCEVLYRIHSLISNGNYYADKFTVRNVGYMSIGQSRFNANDTSISMVGYMFNEIYDNTNFEDHLNESLYDDNVNKYDSSIKSYIDHWYRNNMLNYSNKLEATVFCNDRTIRDNDWSKRFGSYYFTNSNSLECINITDQFSINNPKAELKYPVAMLTSSELANLNDDELRNISSWYWTLTPYSYRKESLMGGISVAAQAMVFSQGKIGGLYSYAKNNISTPVRPAISLKNNNKIISGSGSEEDPWIIE